MLPYSQSQKLPTIDAAKAKMASPTSIEARTRRSTSISCHGRLCFFVVCLRYRPIFQQLSLHQDRFLEKWL